jgi:hypothetical protein
MTDAEILAALEDVYEYAAWLADMGRLEFDAVDALADVIRELRVRAELAA